MLDFLRNLGKSEREIRQEALTAYLDDALTPAERDRFERQLATDEALRNQLVEQRLIKASLSRLPRVSAPRNFTLDPALYGRPVKPTANRLYPAVRAATAIVAILFVIALVLDFSPLDIASREPGQTLADTAAISSEAVEAPAEEAPLALRETGEEAASAEAPLAAEVPVEVTDESERVQLQQSAVEVTRVVVESEEAMEMAVDEAEEVIVEEAEAPSAEDATAGGAPAGEPPPADGGESIVAPEGALATTTATVNEASPQPLSTASAEQAVETKMGTAVAMEETFSVQPTPSEVARLVMPDEADDTIEVEDAVDEATTPTLDAGLTWLQVLTITLGLILVVLAVATVALRQRRR